jgi:hypothetical protein
MSDQPPTFPDDDRWPLQLFRRVRFSNGRSIRGFLHNLDYLETALHVKGYTRLQETQDWEHIRRWQHRRRHDRKVFIECGTWDTSRKWRDDMFIAHSTGRAAWWVRLLPEVLK